MDYISAKQRVSRELKILAEEFWPFMDEKIRENGLPRLEDASNTIYMNLDFIRREINYKKANKFEMLRSLNREKYWDAVDVWDNIHVALREDAAFYAELMIEQAKQGHDKGRFGYCWIVEQYDNGKLADFMPEDLLKDSVNIAFWEIANAYFTCTTSEVPHDWYDTVMKYPKHLDLSQVNKFKNEEKPLLADGNYKGWIDKRYIDAFKKARKKLDSESGAWLARPLIELAFDFAFSWDNAEENQEEILEKNFEKQKLKEYFGTKTVREFFKGEIERLVGAFCTESERDDECSTISHVELLAKYAGYSADGLRRLVSSTIVKEERLNAGVLINQYFPEEWIDSQAMSRIKEEVEADYYRLAKRYASQEIVPSLGILQKAMKKDFFDGKKGREIIAKCLEEYLEIKRHTALEKVRNLINTLKPEFVPDELYKKVRAKVDKDLSISEAISNRARVPRWKRELDKRKS